MRRNDLLVALFFLTATPAMLMSCKKDDENSTPTTTTVSISDTAQSVSENAGTVTLTLSLSQAATQATTLSYTLSGTAVQNGDYEVDSTSQLTIAAGGQTATLKLTIFDDPVVEADKTIQVTFASSAGLSFSHSTATVTIKDNDASQAANGLQTDLVWDAGSPADLDLYVVNNVEIDSTTNTVTNFTPVRGSANEKGFESVLINNVDPDGDYYLVVYYQAGSRNVTYTLTSNGPNITNETGSDTFAAADTGSAYFYGPIAKTGSVYGRLAGGSFDLHGMKTYAYRGRMKQ